MRAGGTYLQARDHAHHYSVSSIRRLLERNGFSRVQFAHLHPAQNIPSGFLQGAKDVWFQAVRALAILTRGRLNLNNLFVLAHKQSQAPP